METCPETLYETCTATRSITTPLKPTEHLTLSENHTHCLLASASRMLRKA